ncbi:Hypothetical protein, putative [Bodo saltans]|uniref:Uncharacterized protein n=1 Tax=Bodo saltans TaxID=75058 RepID=A0A0S4IS95_BODSA|nr:Hypothetical protein, putative [Bodo saltans]|eukprot:CUG05347.1 Hypothetical protein, putative [Bodo saltans]
MDPSKCATALTNYIQKMCSVPLTQFEELAYGVHLYDTLAKVVPSFFTDASTKLQSEGLEGSWVLRKANLLALVTDMTAFARSALSASDEFDVMRLVDVTAAAKTNANDDVAGAGELRSLAEMVFAMCVLSGNQDAIAVIRALPKDDQLVLNQSAKRVMGLYALKPSKKGAAPNNNNNGASSSTATPTVASPAGRLPPGGDASGLLPVAGELSGLQHQVQQLRGELRERQAQVHELEGRIDLAEREKKESQERYRTLLESTEEERGTTQSEKVWAAQLSKKDDNIRELSTAVQDMTSKNTILKSRVESLEDLLDVQRKAAHDAQEQLHQKAEECRESQKQLEVLQDRYNVTMNAKKELNEEVSALRNEVELMKARQAVRGAQEGGAGEETPSRRRRDDDATNNLEDENSLLKEKLNAAVAELRVLRHQQQQLSSHTSTAAATPARSERSASRALEDEASPEAARVMLSSGGSLGTSAADDSLEATVVASGASEADNKALHEGEQSRLLSAELANAQKALSTRDARIVELEKNASSLQSHFLRAQQELEEMKQSVAAEGSADAQALLDAKKESDQLRKQNGELLNRITDRTEATKKEQAILVSTVVQYGHKNLLLQQRQLLGGAGPSDRSDGTASSAKGSGVVGAMASSVMQGWFMDAPARDATEISGSFLTKQRRTVERGLLDRFLVSSTSSSSRHHK